MLNITATPQNAHKIVELSRQFKFTVSHDVIAMAAQFTPKVELTIPGFNFTLRKFQAEGVSFMERVRRVLLGDQPGLGKGVQVMAYAWKNDMFPMAAIVPNTLKLNWRNEITAMIGEQKTINIVGRDLSKRRAAYLKTRFPHVTYTKEVGSGFDIYIINYDIAAKNVASMEELNLKFAAVDESHKIKNEKARRTQAVLQLIRGYKEVKSTAEGAGKWDVDRIETGPGINSVCFMTGTPIVNGRPKEIFTTVNTLAPETTEFSTWLKFAYKFCAPKKIWNGKKHITNFDGASNLNELHDLLGGTIMIRRLKADVLLDLPEKQFVLVPLEFNRTEYDKVVSAFNNDDLKAAGEILMEHGGKAPKSDLPLVEYGKLREMAGLAKLPAAIEWITDFVEQEGTKLVVFAHHREVITQIRDGIIAAYGKGAVRTIFGEETDPEKRDEAKEDFQNKASVRVIVCGLTAAGVGLTLTAASDIAFVEYPWTPGDYEQAYGRIERIGQENAMTMWNLAAEDTVEEDNTALLMAKARINDAAVDGGREVSFVDFSK